MSKLSAEQRKKLPKSSFAVPGKKSGSGSFPVNDKAHAVAAQRMARTPEQKSAVKRKINEKFPDMLRAKSKGKSPFIANRK